MGSSYPREVLLMTVVEAQEGKWEHARLLEAQAQNWHTTISASFFRPKQVMWWNPKTRSHKTKPCRFRGRSYRITGLRSIFGEG